MANPAYVTTSNDPSIDSEQAEEILDEWAFIGANGGDLIVRTDNDTLTFHGYVDFNPYREADVDHPDERYERVDSEGFLEAIAEALEEPLIVQNISHTKCRYPLGAFQWVVSPDGEVHYTSFYEQRTDLEVLNDD